MPFDTPNGTRGGKPAKPNWFTNWGTGMAVKRIRSKRGMFFGMKVLVLNTIGNKSGAERATPVAWFDGGEGRWLVVASAAGAAHNPAWYYNIAGNPDTVSIDLNGEHVAVVPEQLRGVDRDRAWQLITTVSPNFKRYLKTTDRVLPIIRLTPKR